ncbi:MAG: hypothetical protein ACP5I1_05000, partial [Candidatus Hinthialibacter sp.]
GSDAGGNDWGKVGVMIRENGDDPASKHYWIEMRCGPGDPAYGDRTDAQWRDETGSSSGNVQIFQRDGVTNVAQDGLWLRVTRNAANNVLVSEYSYDGRKWVIANTRRIEMAETVAYGLIITSHTDDDQMVIAQASDVKIGPPPAFAIDPQPDDWSAQTLNANVWTAANIGTGPTKDGEASTGGVELSDGTLHITNNGWDMWEDLDGMGFVYQVVAGDFDVACQVVDFDPDVNNGWEKGGLVFRQSLDPGAAYVSSLISRSNGFRAQYRMEQGGGTDRATDPAGVIGSWVRLKREGDVFSILMGESERGPWHGAGTDTGRALPDGFLDIQDPAYLGIAYTPHSTDNTAVTEGTGVFGPFLVFSGASSAENWELFK